MAGWYQDEQAGVRFPLPFEGGERKTTEQIQNLVLAKPGTKLPADVTITSGLYAPAGIPYLLLYTRTETKVPTVSELFDQDFDLKRLDKIIEGDSSGALKTRTLVLAMKDRTTYVGLYYEKDADKVVLDHLRSEVETLPELTLALGELPSGSLSVSWTLIIALTVGAVSAMGYRQWIRRRA